MTKNPIMWRVRQPFTTVYGKKIIPIEEGTIIHPHRGTLCKVENQKYHFSDDFIFINPEYFESKYEPSRGDAVICEYKGRKRAKVITHFGDSVILNITEGDETITRTLHKRFIYREA